MEKQQHTIAGLQDFCNQKCMFVSVCVAMYVCAC